MSVLYTESLSWKAWLLTARLCSSLNGSNTTPSRTGNVRRRSSLGLPGMKKPMWFMINLHTFQEKAADGEGWKCRFECVKALLVKSLCFSKQFGQNRSIKRIFYCYTDYVYVL